MMMMLHPNPTLHIPSYDDNDPFSFDDIEMDEYDDTDHVLSDENMFSSDHFRMYEFKIRRCSRGRSHDWTDCPFAHPGEKARRRDPRKVGYSGNPCPEFRKGACSKGPRYSFLKLTQPCKDGVHCRRRICFFAHTPDQLRVLPLSQLGPTQPESYDGSPSRFVASPTSTLYTSSYSPPLSPVGLGLNELTSSVRNMQIGSVSPRTSVGSGFGSPRNPSMFRPGFASLPSTPTRNPTRVSLFDQWVDEEEEPVMERVESGRDIRAKIYAKLSRENSLAGRVDSASY
ncbi:hypothetical protein Tco_0850392 [Tanacetum coccineum]